MDSSSYVNAFTLKTITSTSIIDHTFKREALPHRLLKKHLCYGLIEAKNPELILFREYVFQQNFENGLLLSKSVTKQEVQRIKIR